MKNKYKSTFRRLVGNNCWLFTHISERSGNPFCFRSSVIRPPCSSTSSAPIIIINCLLIDKWGAATFTTSKNTPLTFWQKVYIIDIYLYMMYKIYVVVFLSRNCKYDSAIAVFIFRCKFDIKLWIWQKVVITLSNKTNCPKHCWCIFASGKNTMNPDK